MKLKGKTTEYEVGALVAQDDRFDIYFCEDVGDVTKRFLLVVAKEGMNQFVDRWAFALGEMSHEAARLEKAYAEVKKDPNDRLNYQLMFPVLMETFKSPGGRQVMILAFMYSEPSAMVPIARMIHKDRLRVDLKTSVWMMGKLLKLLTFAHSQGISMGQVDTGSILIEPDHHHVVGFNWSDAAMYDTLSDDVAKQEIADAALVVVDALEGDAETRVIPNNEGEEGERYIAHLWTLVDGLHGDAAVAHQRFYELVEKLWKRTFYPFTTFPRKGF